MREARIDEAPIKLNGFHHGFNHAPHDGGERKADDEDEHRANDGGQIIEEAHNHAGQRRDNRGRPGAELRQGSHQTQEPDQPIADFANTFTDVWAGWFGGGCARTVAARQERDAVNAFGDRPLHGFGGEVCDDEDQQGQQNAWGPDCKPIDKGLLVRSCHERSLPEAHG
ncbi:MAG: hypothetical protein DCF16_16040 [Alphaproteobacteria bacterium]|nr:MAG: hypothetical protein DCF16_16040 [Alphaproteobacteria bacterium]